MGVVVFDSDVLVGLLNRDDANHEPAVRWVERAMRPGTERWLCAVNYAEILIGPIRAGVAEQVERMLVQLGITTMQVDTALAQRAAEVRVRTGLKLPDAFALATAIHGEHRGWTDVELATFDKKVLRAHADLHPRP